MQKGVWFLERKLNVKEPWFLTMVKEEIVEGLRLAVSKGEPLDKAMGSFYNAGYVKGDIEEAARFFQAPQFQQSPYTSSQQSNFKPLVQPSAQGSQGSSGVVQRVSEYGKKPSRTGAAITIMLFVLLLLLFGILATIILFKDELSNFFNNLFWRALF